MELAADSSPDASQASGAARLALPAPAAGKVRLGPLMEPAHLDDDHHANPEREHSFPALLVIAGNWYRAGRVVGR